MSIPIFQNALPRHVDLDENVENYFKVDESGHPKNNLPPNVPKDRDINDEFEMSDDEIRLTKRKHFLIETEEKNRGEDKDIFPYVPYPIIDKRIVKDEDKNKDKDIFSFPGGDKDNDNVDYDEDIFSYVPNLPGFHKRIIKNEDNNKDERIFEDKDEDDDDTFSSHPHMHQHLAYVSDQPGIMRFLTTRGHL